MEVALFSSPEKAQPIRHKLQEAGIPAEIHETVVPLLWFVRRQCAGFRLEVPADQFERAEQMLLDWDAADGALREAIRCPECGSLRVAYPQYSGKFIGPNLLLGILAEVGFVEREYYCSDCHFTWPKAGSKPRRDRSHQAPYYFLEGVEQTRKPGERWPLKERRRAA